MPEFHYTLRSMITAPEGSKLNDHATGVVLPDGRTLKVWEAFETNLNEEDPRDISFDELLGMGIHYDGNPAELEEE